MSPDPDLNDPTPGMAIWGWMKPVELRWLMSKAKTMDSVVEIGSLHGRSAFALLTACKGPVTCVDTWSDDHDLSYPSFMRSCGHFPNLLPLRMWSHEAAHHFTDQSVDMTFIDGSHVYGGILTDIANWLPKTRKIICGHDYMPGPDAGYPDVARCVHDVFGEERVKVGRGTSIWWIDLQADRSVNKGLPSGTIEFLDEYNRDMSIEVSW